MEVGQQGRALWEALVSPLAAGKSPRMVAVRLGVAWRLLVCFDSQLGFGRRPLQGLSIAAWFAPAYMRQGQKLIL